MKDPNLINDATNVLSTNLFGASLVGVAVCLLLLDIGLTYYKIRKNALQNPDKNSPKAETPETVSVAYDVISKEVAADTLREPEPFEADKKYFDSADIKQLFKIGDKTLYRWRKKATIPFTNMGGRLMYPKLAVLGILQQRLDNRYDPIHIKVHQRM